MLFRSPNKTGGAGSWKYGTGRDTESIAVSSGTDAGTAGYNQDFYQPPHDVHQAGGLRPYGMKGIGGNVYNWEESSDDLANSSGTSFRGFRGSNWATDSSYMASSFRNTDEVPSFKHIA